MVPNILVVARVMHSRAMRAFLLAGVLVACASSEALDESRDASRATAGSGGRSTGIGQGGGSASGGGGSGGVGGSGALGGGDVSSDASAGGGGFSGTRARDVSVVETSSVDAADADRITETRDAVRDAEGGAADGADAEGADAEGGTCGPMFCFDVFECWFLFPQCGYTTCELFACKK